MATVEYISQQLMYQNGVSTSNLDSNYLPTQIEEYQIQEIDKGLLQDDAIAYYQLDQTMIEYDKGALVNTITGVDNSAYSYTQYYKMRGFFPGTSSYETWTSANLPNLNPPSGNTLTDIVIVAVWIA